MHSPIPIAPEPSQWRRHCFSPTQIPAISPSRDTGAGGHESEGALRAFPRKGAWGGDSGSGDLPAGQGPLTQAEDATLRKFSTTADVGFAAASTFFTLPLCFAVNQAHKLVALPPPHRLLTLVYSAGGACVLGKLTYYQYLYGCAIKVLDNGEERMKMELANIILTKHSNENSLVKAVKKHFIAEHLFSDQHQDSPLFSWRQRHSYVDSSFVERAKETEANNSAVARSISGRTIADAIEKDPLACIPGSPDINKLSGDKSTILTRQQLQAHRNYRHRPRHAERTML